ncbi:MAG: hypothetical protein KKH12_15995 [Gammaproteobacteria bacterium]|nr:hypothetical protein [Gammaproteobacteria bacterium]
MTTSQFDTRLSRLEDNVAELGKIIAEQGKIIATLQAKEEEHSRAVEKFLMKIDQMETRLTEISIRQARWSGALAVLIFIAPLAVKYLL